MTSDREVAGAVQRQAVEHRCTTRVYAGSFSGHPCSKPAKVERAGKWYCGTHDPVRVAEKRAAQATKWDAEADARNKARADSAAKQEALERDAALWRAHIAETQRSSHADGSNENEKGSGIEAPARQPEREWLDEFTDNALRNAGLRKGAGVSPQRGAAPRDERAAFEKWARSAGYADWDLEAVGNNGYASGTVTAIWDAWRAALAGAEGATSPAEPTRLRELWEAFKDGFDPLRKQERELIERLDTAIAALARGRHLGPLTDEQIEEWRIAVVMAKETPTTGKCVLDSATVLAIERALRLPTGPQPSVAPKDEP